MSPGASRKLLAPKSFLIINRKVAHIPFQLSWMFSSSINAPLVRKRNSTKKYVYSLMYEGMLACVCVCVRSLSSYVLWGVSLWHCMPKCQCHRCITVLWWTKKKKEMHFHSYSEWVCWGWGCAGRLLPWRQTKLLLCLRHRIRWLRSFSCGREVRKQNKDH